MFVLVLTNVINVICNYLFVMKFGMGSDGVAYGTVIAQYCGLIIALYYFRRHFSHLFSYWSFRATTQWKQLKVFLMVNKDIFIQSVRKTTSLKGVDIRTELLIPHFVREHSFQYILPIVLFPFWNLFQSENVVFRTSFQ